MKRCLTCFLAAALYALACTVRAEEPAAPAAPAKETSTVTAEHLLVELGRQLSDRFQVRGELKLDLARAWRTPVPVAGGYEISILDCPARLTSSLLIHVRLLNEGRACGDQVVVLQAQLFRTVLAVRAPVERETAFDPSQLDSRQVDVLRERDTVSAEDCNGDFTYTTNVQAGRLLTWRDLTRRALVHKGQIIEVAAVDGVMTITTKALAMENGAAGDTIKVRNMTSKKDFTAYVVAEARAEVRF